MLIVSSYDLIREGVIPIHKTAQRFFKVHLKDVSKDSLLLSPCVFLRSLTDDVSFVIHKRIKEMKRRASLSRGSTNSIALIPFGVPKRHNTRLVIPIQCVYVRIMYFASFCPELKIFISRDLVMQNERGFFDCFFKKYVRFSRIFSICYFVWFVGRNNIQV